ncbi:MAG: type VI secretion system-associated FHA domain protein TagH, partial [Candidatus Thiodiazotropha sp.]
MKITLTVKLVAGAPPTQPMTVTFDEQGGSIGRRDENDWVLPDPERFISGRHAQIDCSDESFHITDLSSNGVFINRSAQPLGKNNRVALQDGDSFTIGDYEIGVSVEKPASQTLETNSFAGLDDPFARMVDAEAGQDLEEAFSAPLEQPQSEQVIEEDYSLDEPETPSLELDGPHPESGASSLPSQSDHTSDLNAYFNQPTPIPEDWDLDDDGSDRKDESQTQPPPGLPPLDQEPVPATPPLPSHIPPIQPNDLNEPPPVVIRESIPKPGKQADTAATAPVQAPSERAAPSIAQSSDEATMRRVLAESMGISEQHIADLPMETLLQNLGKILRTSVNGTMSILRARAQMKGEFRMSQTMIQPVENNPLKFSINIEEALRHI